MSDELVTKPAKKLGRPRKYDAEDARKAYELYIVQGLTGRQVAAALDMPRPTVIMLAAQHLAANEKTRKPDTETGPPAASGKPPEGTSARHKEE